MMAIELTVYVTRPAAPLCLRVCEFLQQRGYSYTTIDVSSDEDRARMKARTGFASCPVVVAGEEIIGRLRETVEADRSGRLADLLDAPATPPSRGKTRPHCARPPRSLPTEPATWSPPTAPDWASCRS